MATILLFALLGTAAAQTNDAQPTVEATQGEWGMRIVFAPSTTITEANALRLEHSLQLQPTGYVSDDGRHFTYRYANERNYAGFAQFYWSDTEHDGCSVSSAEQPCPAIEPRYGYYAPVTSRVADQLRQDPRVAQVDNHNDPAFAQTDEPRILADNVTPLGGTDERRYWPDGVKLDSKIIFNSDGEPVRHEVRWILTWDSTNHFFFTDYYAHDLYLEKEGGTFLDPNSTSIRTADTTLPLTGLYHFNDGPNRLRVGWATYRPSFIEAGTIYTVTIESSVVDTTPIDYAVEDIETYGIRIPSICNGTNLPCLWWPTSWCSIAPGGNTLQLFNNGHPNGIFPLGTPLGGCNTLYYLFLPILTTQQ